MRSARDTRRASLLLLAIFVAGCHLKPSENPAPANDEETLAATDGSSGILEERDLENRRVTRFEELLEARVAGVRVRRLPNGDYSIQIRGVNALNGSTEPLFVLDGVPLLDSRSLAGINPADVARIEVLKDGTAAAYGTRGANGVILITTRGP